jgi:hypothetical protein
MVSHAARAGYHLFSCRERVRLVEVLPIVCLAYGKHADGPLGAIDVSLAICWCVTRTEAVSL